MFTVLHVQHFFYTNQRTHERKESKDKNIEDLKVAIEKLKMKNIRLKK